MFKRCKEVFSKLFNSQETISEAQPEPENISAPPHIPQEASPAEQPAEAGGQLNDHETLKNIELDPVKLSEEENKSAAQVDATTAQVAINDKTESVIAELQAKRFEYRIDPSVQSVQSVQSVAIAGSFNDWQAQGMRLENDIWLIDLDLATGSYSYKFVVNGSDWILDPANADTLKDEEGNLNSVIHVV